MHAVLPVLSDHCICLNVLITMGQKEMTESLERDLINEDNARIRMAMYKHEVLKSETLQKKVFIWF